MLLLDKMWIERLCLCLGVVVAVLANDELPSKVVKTVNGAVRGFQVEPGVYEYLDIPYAMVPWGPAKFGSPLPSPIWLDTRDAVDTGIICPQGNLPFPLGLENKTKDENCLLASVFVPDITQTKLPVVVYVHGGGFQVGYGNMLKPYELVRDHNIIAVTFNYRVGVHGFLCLGTDDIPGNAGMKDQVALLRWVQKNIVSFGGNPDDVTIAGYSAGSASVDLLMLSKSATGLFNKVIPESGANIAVFSTQQDPLETAKWFAKSLEFDNVDDVDALAQFYKTASWDQLTSDVFVDRTNSTFAFVPCVERPLSSVDRAYGKEVFLDESPAVILKNGKFKKVPLLYGFANMEGLLRVSAFDMWKTRMNEKFSDFLPADLIFKSEEEKEDIAKKVKEYYFGDKPVDTGNILKYVDYFSDVMFAYATLRSVKLQVEKGHDQIYLYEFNYVDENTPTVPHTNVRGADHCAQTMAVFAGKVPTFFNIKMTEEYKKLTTIIRQIWANFIKSGKPVPEGSDLPSWPAVSSDWSPHMSLGNEIELKGSLLLERSLFWEDIYNKYYREPMPPPLPYSNSNRNYAGETAMMNDCS